MRRPLCLACLVVTALIALRLQLFPEQFPGCPGKEKEIVTVTGMVAEKEYRQQKKGRVLQLRLKRAVLEGETQEYGVLCTLEDTASVPVIGSTLRVQGRLYLPERAENPGQFDQAVYYRTQDVDLILRECRILGMVHDRRTASAALAEGLFRLREFLGHVLELALNAEDAGILKAMLLGTTGELSDEIRDLYQGSGIIHVLAISALHISIIGMGVWRLLRRCHLPLPLCCGVSVAVMLLYGQMTGLSASSFRAIFLFLLQMTAKLIRRTYDLLTGVCLAAVLLLVQEPLYLYNSGFLFSFGAVLAIAVLSPALGPDNMGTGHSPCGASDLRFSHGVSAAGRVLQVPISVALVTLPVNLAFYGTFPIYSILLNLAVLPLMSLVMAAGLGLLGVGSLLLPAAGLGMLPAVQLTGIPAHLILTFYRNLCSIVTALPGHSLVLGQSRPWQLWIYFLLLLCIALLQEELPVLLRYLVAAGALLLLLQRSVPGVSVQVISVGQGDGILVQSEVTGCGTGFRPQGVSLMIDGGSTSVSSVGKYRIEPFLCARGAGRIGLWVITHGDEDHTSGLIELLEEENGPVRIEKIVLPWYAGCEEAPGAGNSCPAGEGIPAIRRLAAKRGIPVIFLSAGDRIRYSGGFLSAANLELACLHPGKGADYSDPNAYSVTLLLRYGRFSALLTGDLEGAGERDMLHYLEETGWKDAGNVTLLKTAHHGSSGATSEAFLKAVHPSMAVISCGRNNRYHHPHGETLERLRCVGAALYDTRYTGAVEFRSDGRKVRVRSFVDAKRQHMVYYKHE